jgi:hypothetical protein
MSVVERIDAGHVIVDTCREAGRVERGLFSVGDCDCSDADGLMEVGERIRPGVHRIESYIPYTMRGPARVASPAFRSGWDRVFGARERASN